MKTKNLLPIAVAALGSIAIAAEKADKNSGASADSKDKASPTAQPSPYLKSNNSWITLTGKVTSANSERFTLDYGKGSVTVEMDGWAWYDSGHSVLEGDHVTVSGKVDRDKGEFTKIEASSVYVKGLNTFFYANASDEEDYIPTFVTVQTLPDTFELQGVVTELNGREFTLSHATGSTIIDTDEMSYDPTDDEGYQKIRLGDVVRVYGEFDEGFFEADEIKASTIITLVKN